MQRKLSMVMASQSVHNLINGSFSGWIGSQAVSLATLTKTFLLISSCEGNPFKGFLNLRKSSAYPKTHFYSASQNLVMLCGSRSFSHVDEGSWSTEAPRKSRKKGNRNPYSSRGLDKFATVLAELEARREKIMSQMGPQEVPLVRFVHSNSEDWIPIVVKLKHPKEEKSTEPMKSRNHHQVRSASAHFQPSSEATQKSVNKEAAAPLSTTTTTTTTTTTEAAPDQRKAKRWLPWSLNQSWSGSLKWRPGCYWPLVLILILLCLAMFGRSFAIICTSVWWYMVPVLKGEKDNFRKSLKKDYGRRMSGKKLTGDSRTGQSKASSPRSHLSGR